MATVLHILLVETINTQYRKSKSTIRNKKHPAFALWLLISQKLETFSFGKVADTSDIWAQRRHISANEMESFKN